MNISERLREDLNSSLKKGNRDRAGVLRMLLSELYNKEKDKQAKGEKPILGDDEAIVVIQRESKKRKEAIELFKKGGRDDLVKKEESELEVVNEYLPKELGRDEVAAVIDGIIAKGLGEFNLLMKEAMKELKGRADGRLVAELIKEKISHK